MQQPVVEAIDEGFGETRLGDAGEIENRAAVRLQAVEGQGAPLPKFHKVTGMRCAAIAKAIGG